MDGQRGGRNPFKAGIRGSVKSNAQIDSFVKSQEVFELLQNTIGSPSPPKGFRIPRKSSPQRGTSNDRLNPVHGNHERNSRNRSSFNRQEPRKSNSRENDRRSNQRSPNRGQFSRRDRSRGNHSPRANEPSSSSFGKHPRKRRLDDSPLSSGFESSKPKYSAYSEVFDDRNTARRDYEKPSSFRRLSSDRDQLDYPTSSARHCFQYKGDNDCRDVPRRDSLYSSTQQFNESSSADWSRQRYPSSERPRQRYPSSERHSSDRDRRYFSDSFGRRQSNENFESSPPQPAWNPDSSDMPRGDDPYSNMHMRQVEEPSPTERPRQRYPSNERHSIDKDRRYFSDEYDRQQEPGWNADIYSAHSQDQESDNKSKHDNVPELTEAERKKQKLQRKRLKRLTKKSEKAFLSKPCVLEVRDNSDPAGKIAEHNVPTLVKSILEILEVIALMNPLKKDVPNPRYLGHSYRNGQFEVMCADFSSRHFLLRRLEKMTPPWEGALLKCIEKVYNECLVDVKVPSSIRHLSEFRSICEENNRSVDTKSWRSVGYEDLEDSKQRLYTIGMDKEAYGVIHGELDDRLRCGEEYVTFVLHEKKKPQAIALSEDLMEDPNM